jgi:hypothetical protein
MATDSGDFLYRARLEPTQKMPCQRPQARAWATGPLIDTLFLKHGMEHRYLIWSGFGGTTQAGARLLSQGAQRHDEAD